MKKLYVILVFIFTVSSVNVCLAQNINTPENFPDPNFRAAVETIMGVAPGGVFSAAQAAQITWLDVASDNIASVSGIEFFIGLSYLRCSDNQITSLDVSQNSALTDLWCSNNQITSLDVTQNSALIILVCMNNQLMSLDISHNFALKELWCDDNQLVSLNLSQNTDITNIVCRNNQLMSLDICQNSALIELWCSNNILTSLDVSNSSFLTVLDCSKNQLTSLDVSQDTSMTSLYCSNNQLLSINVSQNIALTDLFCSYNQLTSLDVSHNTALTNLYCFNNGIEDIILANPNNLTLVYCHNNNICNVDLFANNSSIGYGDTFDIRYNDLDYGDWNDVLALKNRLSSPTFSGDPVSGWLLSGFAYTPQNNYDPYDFTNEVFTLTSFQVTLNDCAPTTYSLHLYGHATNGDNNSIARIMITNPTGTVVGDSDQGGMFINPESVSFNSQMYPISSNPITSGTYALSISDATGTVETYSIFLSSTDLPWPVPTITSPQPFSPISSEPVISWEPYISDGRSIVDPDLANETYGYNLWVYAPSIGSVWGYGEGAIAPDQTTSLIYNFNDTASSGYEILPPGTYSFALNTYETMPRTIKSDSIIFTRCSVANVEAFVPSNQNITIQSPNGSETWQAGTTHDIVYSATGNIQSASLYYSTNAGSSWNFIAGPVSVTNGTNTYSWLIPSVSSSTCLVRVSRATDWSDFDVSNNNFNLTVDPTWQRISTSGPGVCYARMTYDSFRKKTVLFGGSPFGGGSVLNDVWEWNGFIWTKIDTSTKPHERNSFGMTYDSTRHRVVIFGGNDPGQQYLSDLWGWDGSNWTLIAPNGSGPQGRDRTQISYDPYRDSIVMFGGGIPGGTLADTWEWSGSQWNSRSLGVPSPRGGHNMAYDLKNRNIVLYGGHNNSSYVDSTWLWDGSSWNRIADQNPGLLFDPGMSYDSLRNRTLLHGGAASYPTIDSLSKTWEWDGNQWSLLTNDGPERWAACMAYDSQNHQLILYGGCDDSGIWHDDTWILPLPYNSPALSLTPTALNVHRGQDVEIAANISDATGVIGYRIALNLDPAKVSYVEDSATKLGTSTETGWGPIVVNSASPEMAIFTCASASGTISSGSASLMKFQLHINGSLPDFTSITVTFNPLTSLNEDAIAYTAEIWSATVMGPNNQPSFSSGGPVYAAEDCGPQTVTNWATDIVPGPSYESWQLLYFTVEGYNPTLFSATPAIDTSGTLRFTPALNANGITSATVYLYDSGGTENGGNNVSVAHSLIISVTPVNDAPSFIHGATVTVVNRMPPMIHAFLNFATAITAGPPDEVLQWMVLPVSTNHPEKFIMQPYIPGGVGIQSATLLIMPATNAHGVIQAQVCLYDSGGQDLGGVNHSATDSFTIRMYKRFRWGDLNANDQAGSVDASLLLQYQALLIETFPGFPKSEYPEYYPPYYSVAFPQAADVNADGIAGTLDASLILQKYVFLIEYFPADLNHDHWGPDAPMPPTKVALRNVERRLTVSVEGQGSSWIVKFKLDNALDLSGLRLVLLYDPSQVSVDEKAAQWLVPSGMLVTNNLQEGRFIVAGALSVPLGEGPSELMSVKFDRIVDSANSIVIRLDEAMTQFNDGQIQLTPNSMMVFDLMNPTEVREWMIH